MRSQLQYDFNLSVVNCFCKKNRNINYANIKHVAKPGRTSDPTSTVVISRFIHSFRAQKCHNWAD